MAQPPIQKPQYPDVPQANGVPAIFRDPTAIVFTTVLLAADVATVARQFQGPQWGIFTKQGFPRIIPDSVISVDFRKEWRLSDYPIEEGSFEHYNKVQLPFDVRVRMACSGTGWTPRDLFLAQIDNAATTLETYTVVTPDINYYEANVTHYDYRRERQGGATMIIADIWLQEVRTSVQTQFTSTKSPQGAANVNTGSVQPAAPTPTQAATGVSPARSAATTPGIRALAPRPGLA